MLNWCISILNELQKSFITLKGGKVSTDKTILFNKGSLWLRYLYKFT